MSVQPPAWAMGAVALADSTDPHLAPGVHLRIITAAALGLPLRPFVVYRLAGEALQRALPPMTRSGMTWIDSRGRVLTPPFRLERGNPVVGRVHRAPGERCIAISVATDREGPLDPVLFPEHALAGGRGEPLARPPSGIVVSGFVDGPLGPRVVARQHAAPFCVGASALHGVIVEGEGAVRDARWLVANLPSIERLRPTRLLDLPVTAGARYVGLANAEQNADDRILRGAPRRVGMHEHPDAAGPSACNPTNRAEERDRVLQLVRELREPLRRVLDDLSDRPGAHAMPITLDEGPTNDPAAGPRQAKVNCLKALLTGAADPGVARWLGYQDVDDDPAVLAAGLVVYLVRGFFAPDHGDFTPTQADLFNGVSPLATPISEGALPFGVPARSIDGHPVYDFLVPVVAFPTTPPARPASPTIGDPIPGSDRISKRGVVPIGDPDPLGSFVPDVLPPEARREVAFPLSGLEAPPFLAANRLHDARFHPLNGTHPRTGRALPIVPARPSTATEAGAGHLFDRDAPAETCGYVVAQADAFGRWSDWAVRLLPEKTRPSPPAPSLEVHYTPADATPLDDAPRFGTLRVRVAVPKVEALAAGSRALASATVTAVVGGVTVTASQALVDPSAKTLLFTLPAPAGHIARAATVDATVTARWRDTANVDGPPGERTLTLCDLRPLPPLVVPTSLRYTARPDATGRARAVLTWTAPAKSRYRIYFADETGLRAALAAANIGNLPAANADAATRATGWTAIGSAALREHFTLLTAEPITAAIAGEQRYAYDLSGSLAVLAFFKILPVSEGNVEGSFTEAALIPFTVPREGGPTRPLLDFDRWEQPADGGPLTARLRLTLVRGPQQPVRWRLRRSFATSDDPRAMPIVASGDIPPPVGDAAQIVAITDPGPGAPPSPVLPLRPWTRTSWRVEVQADTPAAALGTRAPPGEWSPASAAADHMYIPPPPTAPTDVAIDATADATALRWKHPEALTRGGRGGYRFEIYRRPPAGREERVATLLADDPTVAAGAGAARVFRYTDTAAAVAGTTWRVIVIDPAGRQSPPSTAVARS